MTWAIVEGQTAYELDSTATTAQSVTLVDVEEGDLILLGVMSRVEVPTVTINGQGGWTQVHTLAHIGDSPANLSQIETVFYKRASSSEVGTITIDSVYPTQNQRMSMIAQVLKNVAPSAVVELAADNLGYNNALAYWNLQSHTETGPGYMFYFGADVYAQTTGESDPYIAEDGLVELVPRSSLNKRATASGRRVEDDVNSVVFNNTRFYTQGGTVPTNIGVIAVMVYDKYQALDVIKQDVSVLLKPETGTNVIKQDVSVLMKPNTGANVIKQDVSVLLKPNTNVNIIKQSISVLLAPEVLTVPRRVTYAYTVIGKKE